MRSIGRKASGKDLHWKRIGAKFNLETITPSSSGLSLID
jgi:hypothetical protein